MIETSLLKGKGALTLTGSLGDVMQESARAAVSLRAQPRRDLRRRSRFPREEATFTSTCPKGRSRRTARRPASRWRHRSSPAVTRLPVLKDVAMTGEITLRGKVLPVGGIKDKVLAAFRAGIDTIVLPAENEKDLDEIPKEVREAIEVHLVENMDEVIKVTLDHAAVAKPPEVEGKLFRPSARHELTRAPLPARQLEAGISKPRNNP